MLWAHRAHNSEEILFKREFAHAIGPFGAYRAHGPLGHGHVGVAHVLLRKRNCAYGWPVGPSSWAIWPMFGPFRPKKMLRMYERARWALSYGGEFFLGCVLACYLAHQRGRGPLFRPNNRDVACVSGPSELFLGLMKHVLAAFGPSEGPGAPLLGPQAAKSVGVACYSAAIRVNRVGVKPDVA